MFQHPATLNTAAITDHRTIYEAAGISRNTGDAYEQLLRIDLNGLMEDGDLLGRVLDTVVLAHLRAQIAACESTPRLFHLRQEKVQQKADARHVSWLRDELGDRFIGGVVLHTGPWAFIVDDRIAAAPVSSLWSSRGRPPSSVEGAGDRLTGRSGRGGWR